MLSLFVNLCFVCGKAIEKDWNDDVKKLREINYKIQTTLNLKKELDYTTFRELYPHEKPRNFSKTWTKPLQTSFQNLHA